MHVPSMTDMQTEARASCSAWTPAYGEHTPAVFARLPGVTSTLVCFNNLQAAHGVNPGTNVTIKSTSDTLHLTLAYAAASSFVAALQEWRDLHGARAKETYK